MLSRLPPLVRANLTLRAFGFFRVPLLFAVRPRVLELSPDRCVIKIHLRRRVKNHLGSMYFGALAIGADAVVGLHALHVTDTVNGQVVLAFKDFHAEFLRRPESDVLFVSEEGAAMRAFVAEVLASPDRQNRSFAAYAALASAPTEPVARFTLTLSLKRKA